MSIPEERTGIYRGQTLDDRVEDRRNQLLDATLTVISEGGAAAVTVRAVTRVANLSPRYFYESFADRSQLLTAAADRAFRNMQLAVDDAMAEADNDPLEQTRAAIGAVCTSLDDDPRLGRFLREAQAEPDLRARLETDIPAFIGITSSNLADETWYKSADPKLVALDICALSGAMIHLLSSWTENRLDIPRAQFIDYCTGIVGDMIRRRSL
ncbi:TetR/AcrR family transcriptional regulator [Nocardia asteroides]|uniref:TetR/AcrR family transcriptional regulator n=1 Tax=Nocardia asteroides TaxID=1824 RepID=UPI0033C595DA